MRGVSGRLSAFNVLLAVQEQEHDTRDLKCLSGLCSECGSILASGITSLRDKLSLCHNQRTGSSVWPWARNVFRPTFASLGCKDTVIKAAALCILQMEGDPTPG